jgi:hypothetical protein
MVYNYFNMIVVNLYVLFIDLGKIFYFTKPIDERRMLKKRGYVRK